MAEDIATLLGSDKKPSPGSGRRPKFLLSPNYMGGKNPKGKGSSPTFIGAGSKSQSDSPYAEGMWSWEADLPRDPRTGKVDPWGGRLLPESATGIKQDKWALKYGKEWVASLSEEEIDNARQAVIAGYRDRSPDRHSERRQLDTYDESAYSATFGPDWKNLPKTQTIYAPHRARQARFPFPQETGGLLLDRVHFLKGIKPAK